MTVLDIRFSDWIQEGFSLFTRHATVLLVSGLVMVAISAVTLGLLLGPMLAGMTLIVLNLRDERLSRPTLNDLFKGFDYFKDTLPVTLAFYGLALAGFLLHFIPYIGQVINTVAMSVGAATAVMTVFHLVNRRVPPRTSAQAWWEIFKVNWGPLLGFYILALLIGGSGVLACGVGLVATVPLYLCILGAAYAAIFQQSADL
jgi:hypothetical protein